MSNKYFNLVNANKLFSRLIIGFTILFISVAWLLPLMSGIASASQLTSRSLSIATAQPSVSNNWTYTFTYVSSASAIQSIKFVACTTAVGTYGLASVSTVTGCTVPAGININGGVPNGALTGTWTNTTAFARDAVGAGNCNPTVAGATNNVLCIKRTQAAAESAASKTLSWTAQTNPSTVNTAFFVGVYLYSDAAWATPTDSGTVASAVVQTLTINAAVAEILNFCVGSTGVDDATTSVAADCTSVGGTSVNLGTLDSTHINITPVTTNCSAGDCTKNGVAMVRSNAINGTAVYYDAIAQSGTNHQGTLRISGATCTADTVNASVDSTDQCFNERPAQATFAAGTERFGFTIAGVNCGSTTSYTCTFATGAYDLTRDAAYDGTGGNTYNTTDKDQITGPTTNGYAYDETATPTIIATSSASTTKVIDDEALILKFAASPAITTPFGAYTAKDDFIAVATY